MNLQALPACLEKSAAIFRIASACAELETPWALLPIPDDGPTGSWTTTRPIGMSLGSEEARSRAGLRPPPKLPVPISGRQLSRRLSNAERPEKELSRSDEQARTRRKAGP